LATNATLCSAVLGLYLDYNSGTNGNATFAGRLAGS